MGWIFNVFQQKKGWNLVSFFFVHFKNQKSTLEQFNISPESRYQAVQQTLRFFRYFILYWINVFLAILLSFRYLYNIFSPNKIETFWEFYFQSLLFLCKFPLVHKSEQKVIGNWFWAPIIFKNPLKLGFSIRNILNLCRRCLYIL